MSLTSFAKHHVSSVKTQDFDSAESLDYYLAS